MSCGCGVVWQVRTLTGHSHAVRSAAFSPNGDCIVSGSDDGFVKIWDVTGAEVSSLVGVRRGLWDDGDVVQGFAHAISFLKWECGLEPPMFAFFLSCIVLQVV
jgi:WD40 repeat protein